MGGGFSFKKTMKKTTYIFKRLLQIIPMLLIVSALAFALSNASSGDVASIIARSRDIEPTIQNGFVARIRFLLLIIPIVYFFL